jgi:hypothetical protein
MITVPSCAACNQGAAASDEMFRIYLGATTAYHDDDATRAWKDGAVRTLQSNRRLMKEFLRNVGEPIRFSDGSEGIPIAIPAEMYRKTCERIARGLFYRHFSFAPGARMQCEVNPLAGITDELFAITGDWQGDSVGTSAFVYRFGPLEGTLRSVWIFQFFNSHWTTVETYPRGEAPLPTQSLSSI